jgi:hypothetical protein
MSDEQAGSNHEADQPVCFTVFHLFGLILAGVVAFGLAKDGWACGGFPGLLGGLVLGALFAPVAFILVSLLALLAMLLLVFVACEEMPVGFWMARLRTVLRGAAIAGGIAWILRAIPGLMQTTTWKDFSNAALAGVVVPCGAIFFLFMSRLEGLSERGHQEGPSSEVAPTTEANGESSSP